MNWIAGCLSARRSGEEMPRVYAAYEFHRVYHAIHDFCVVDLSSFYYDVLKDRLYTKAAKNKSRRSGQTAVWKITSALVRLLAPILCSRRRRCGNSCRMVQVNPAAFTSRSSRKKLSADGHRARKSQYVGLAGESSRRVLKALEVARNEKKLINSGWKRSIVERRPGAEAKLKQYLAQLRAVHRFAG